MSLIWSLLQYLVFGLVQDEPAGLPWLEQRPLLVKDTFIAPAHTHTALLAPVICRERHREMERDGEREWVRERQRERERGG